MNIEALRQRRQIIDEYIHRSFEDFQAALPEGELSELSQWAFRVAREYSLGSGKRLRGSLAMALYDELTDGAHEQAAGYLAASIELMHNYLLIIDDAMDESPLRRHMPTVHESYRDTYARLGPTLSEAHFAAVNVATLVQHVANWAMTAAERAAMAPTGVLSQEMHRYIALTTLGQLDDLAGVVGRTDSAEATLRRYRKKSSYYSFVNPLVCALALAGRLDEAARQQIIAFGMPAGIAFQLRDDWLGLFGDSHESGKANLDDIREGKNTFLVQAALQRADATARRQLLSMIGDKRATIETVMRVRQIVTDTGAVRAADELMRQMVDEADVAIGHLTCVSASFAELLREVITYTMERKK